LVANGFNHALIYSYAYDPSWKAGKSEAEDWGPPALLPWLGSKGSEDFTRMNVPYWNHYDQLMEALRQRGIIAHIYIRVHNKPDITIFPANNSTGDNLWWQWMVARYAAYPNVVFDGAKEWNYEASVAYKQARLQLPFRPAPTRLVVARVRRLRLLIRGRMGFAHFIRPPPLGHPLHREAMEHQA